MRFRPRGIAHLRGDSKTTISENGCDIPSESMAAGEECAPSIHVPKDHPGPMFNVYVVSVEGNVDGSVCMSALKIVYGRARNGAIESKRQWRPQKKQSTSLEGIWCAKTLSRACVWCSTAKMHLPAAQQFFTKIIPWDPTSIHFRI